MGFRKTGEQYWIKGGHVEQFCDWCNETIPLEQYPEITLEVEWHEYLGPEFIYFCSFRCLADYAEAQKPKGLV